MAVSIARWYKRERLELTVEFVTPAFLGNWEQKAELRAAPFKALLRYWWRVVEGHRYETAAELYRAESALFGSADEAGQSQLSISVLDKDVPLISDLGQGPTINHPEVEQTGHKVGAWLYLGYGPIGMVKGKGLQVRPPLKPEVPFKLVLDWPSRDERIQRSLKHILSAVSWFGAVGSRSRNGWGSLRLQGEGFQPLSLADFRWQQWETLLEKPYPWGLGRDGKDYLLWSTKNEHRSWEGAMEELAKVYVQVRTALMWTKPSGEVDNRHLLGYPVGDQKKKNHMVRDWDAKGFSRHASMLRLIVRRDGQKFIGMILHAPHAFGTDHAGVDAPEVWKEVHNRLDSLLMRLPHA
jgi:CRISPR-associated protein Cmr1